MATIRERPSSDGPRYFVEIRLKGQRPVRRSFRRRTDARRWAVQTEAAIRERRYFRTVEAERHTFAELVDRYLREVQPAPARQAQLAWWRERWGDRVLADLGKADITELKTLLATTPTVRGTTRSPATVNRYLAALSHCYSKALEWEWLDAHPLKGGRIARYREPRGRVRYLSDAEREALLAACRASSAPLLYPLVVLALSTGARAGELLALRWGDLDLRSGRGVLQETKNGERRAIAIRRHALDELRRLARVRRLDTDLVFPGTSGRVPWSYFPDWRAAVAAAGIEDFRFHDLRHCAASYLAMNGATLAEIAAVLGHKTLQMVKRYAHLSDAHIGAAVDSMNERLFG